MDLLDYFKNGADTVKFGENEIIFRQGDPGDFMYIIKEGEISLNIGNTVEYIAVSGEFIGEMSLIDESPRSATAVAENDCELIRVDRDKFFKLIKKHPDFSILVMRVLVERLRYMDTWVQ